MREIKFRAWCSGTMGKITFSKSAMEYGVSIGEHGGYLDIESGWDIHGEIMEIPIMQCTGLKDKNDKEIYEGDIVKTIFGNSKIFNRLGCWFVENERELGYYNLSEIEVIGNIYENPELLTLKKK